MANTEWFPYQPEAFWTRKRLRRYLLSWLRQGRKTSTLAEQALSEMMERPNHLVTFASASLAIGSEMIEKEARTFHALLAGQRAKAADLNFRLAAVETRDVRGESGNELPEDLPWEDLASIIERNRFQLKMWHSNTVCSRTNIIAAVIATCRSWSGSVKFDEIAFVKDLETLLAEFEPFMSTDPAFTFVMATTPPPDFGHFAYELLSEENGREEWPLNPKGNWYQNKLGLWVHRVTIDDAALAGRQCYDADTGALQTVDENRMQSLNRDGWDRSNRLLRPKTGTSMISPLAVDLAMSKGRNYLAIEGDLQSGDMEKLLKLLKDIGPGTVTLGNDLATTEKKKSNPTALALCVKRGMMNHFPLIWWWKTAKPEESRRRITGLLQVLKDNGIKVRGMGVDASNERFFATDLRNLVRKLFKILVRLVMKGSRAKYKGEEMTMGAYLGNLTANAFEDGFVACPNNRYLANDFARKKKDGDGFTATVGINGEHADTLDAIELALAEQVKGMGTARAEGVAVGDLAGTMHAGGNQFRSSLKNPLLKKLGQIFRINS